jgi:hypothetical protein
MNSNLVLERDVSALSRNGRFVLVTNSLPNMMRPPPREWRDADGLEHEALPKPHSFRTFQIFPNLSDAGSCRNEIGEARQRGYGCTRPARTCSAVTDRPSCKVYFR